MPQQIALVRRPSSRLGDGILTHMDRVPVDPALAAEQHAGYVAALAGAGWEVRDVEPADELPDSAFIEDAVVAFEGLRQLGELVAPRGGTVVPVALDGVLHLRSAVTALPDGTIVCADEDCVDTDALPRVRAVPEEAGSHVVLLGENRVLMATSAPRSAAMFREMGLDVIAVDISEFEKMEGCVTCLSVLVDAAG